DRYRDAQDLCWCAGDREPAPLLPFPLVKAWSQPRARRLRTTSHRQGGTWPMSLLPSPLAAALAGAVLACFAIEATRRPDPWLQLTGLAVLAFALAPVPAYADQFVEAADHATIDCELARGELTRIALIDDGFAN